MPEGDKKAKQRHSQFNELMADMVKFEEVLASSPLPRSGSRDKRRSNKKSKNFTK